MSRAMVGANPAPGFVNHPEHIIKVEPYLGSIAVWADGVRIAESHSAILLHETNHAPTFYLPIEDIDPLHLRPSAHVTRCPFKGKASYWNVVVGEHEIDNALWAYETPYDEMLELAGMAAFFASKVRIEANPRQKRD